MALSKEQKLASILVGLSLLHKEVKEGGSRQFEQFDGLELPSAKELDDLCDELNINDVSEQSEYAQYMASGGNECLACKSENLESGKMETDSGGAHQAMECADCTASWDDIYVHVGVDNVKLP